MSKMKFYCDENLCIECNACVIACNEGNESAVGTNRRRVVTLNEGIEGKEISFSIACMHCVDAPCQAACPKGCFYTRDDGIVLHDKGRCIGCQYCLFACPFGAPQFPEYRFGKNAVMDKCTMCAGGPVETFSSTEHTFYGQNRLAEGKVPLCASMCSTKALVVGESTDVLDIYQERNSTKPTGSFPSIPFGWKKAYGG